MKNADTKIKKSALRKCGEFLKDGMWNMDLSEVSKLKAAGVMLARVVASTYKGVIKNRIPVQAASLSYATLLALGPILALTLLISGMFFKDKGETFIYEKFMDIATFVMPAMGEMLSSSEDGGQQLNPEVVNFIDNIYKGSSSLGAYGVFMIIITCLLLCVNLETAVNAIWSQRKGRRWVDRFVFYFSLIFFGSVGVISGMTVLTTSQIAGIMKYLPFLSGYASWVVFFVGMLMMAGVLTAFYKFIPVVQVKWKAALVGGVVALLLIVLNNKLSFIYISYIAKQQSFYGYFSVVAVAMFSLYIFWLFILTGAQITCSVQMADFISDESVWEKSGSRTHELLSLAAFAEICRAFYDKRQAPTLSDIVEKLRVPKQTLAICVSDMVERGLVCQSPSESENSLSFRPSIPPDSITLADFFTNITSGEVDKAVDDGLARSEPIVRDALEAFAAFGRVENASKTIRDLLRQ